MLYRPRPVFRWDENHGVRIDLLSILRVGHGRRVSEVEEKLAVLSNEAACSDGRVIRSEGVFGDQQARACGRCHGRGRRQNVMDEQNPPRRTVYLGHFRVHAHIAPREEVRGHPGVRPGSVDLGSDQRDPSIVETTGSAAKLG